MSRLSDVLEREIARLKAFGAPAVDARRDVEVLARHVLGWDRATLLLRRDEPAPGTFESGLATLVSRRAVREPVAYITGTREFWGLDFEVTPAVLIPRPETELVVERALAALDSETSATLPAAVVVDVGTGSGCLAVALARERPALTVVATDVSGEALAIARRNAVRHGVATRVHLVRGDLLTAFAHRPLADLIVSNPPYVPDESPDVAADVRATEPPGALFSGPDGLDHIERLVAAALAVVRPGGHLIFELGSGQAKAVRALMVACGWLDVELWPDLQGIPRVAVARRP
jgi:release factor glutamine methyltransferase